MNNIRKYTGHLVIEYVMIGTIKINCFEYNYFLITCTLPEEFPPTIISSVG